MLQSSFTRPAGASRAIPPRGFSQPSPAPDIHAPPTGGTKGKRPRLHVGIIMDGNGRWARSRGLPRTAGHTAGASAVRRTVAAAPGHGIDLLTLYAFSADNWLRPDREVRHLMRLLRAHLRSEADRCAAEGVRVSVIGRRDRLDPGLLHEIRSVESRTRQGDTLHLQLAIDYSSRDAILAAVDEAAREAAHQAAQVGRARVGTHAQVIAAPVEAVHDLSADTDGVRRSLTRVRRSLTRDELRARIARALHAGESIPDVDLIIRTGGEQRLSDFLLWEGAYAEILFTPCLWPDFEEEGLAAAMEWFAQRDRRFGGLPNEQVLTSNQG
jgi:undecaprenyl diphosphate synthase